MKLKKMIFLTMIGVFMMAFMACSNDNDNGNTTDETTTSPTYVENPTENDDLTTGFVNNFPRADMSEYELEDDHRFYEVSMYEALQLRDDENFDGILYFGFPRCPWCQAAVPFIHEMSQEVGVDIFYISRAHDLREGEWVDWDVEMAWWFYENGVENMLWLYTAPDEDADEDEIEAFEPERIRPNINVPQIVHLRNGIVVDSHRGTFEGHEHVGEGDDRHLPELTDAESAALLEIYNRIFSSATTDGCSLIEDAEACD